MKEGNKDGAIPPFYWLEFEKVSALPSKHQGLVKALDVLHNVLMGVHSDGGRMHKRVDYGQAEFIPSTRWGAT